jgi:hypothetical protein
LRILAYKNLSAYMFGVVINVCFRRNVLRVDKVQHEFLHITNEAVNAAASAPALMEITLFGPQNASTDVPLLWTWR